MWPLRCATPTTVVMRPPNKSRQANTIEPYGGCVRRDCQPRRDGGNRDENEDEDGEVDAKEARAGTTPERDRSGGSSGNRLLALGRFFPCEAEAEEEVVEKGWRVQEREKVQERVEESSRERERKAKDASHTNSQ
jgi:hypothetical protein